jgi:hypothetical protein
MTYTATVTTAATAYGTTYAVTLSDGTVATRRANKTYTALAFAPCGKATAHTEAASNAARLVSRFSGLGLPYVVVCLQTGAILFDGTAAKAATVAPAPKAAPASKVWEKFQNAPARVAKQARRDVAFWGASHPNAALWATVAERAEALTSDDLAALYALGLRTSGDLQSRLERQAEVERRDARG